MPPILCPSNSVAVRASSTPAPIGEPGVHLYSMCVCSIAFLLLSSPRYYAIQMGKKALKKLVANPEFVR